jgi:hypothetical protein
MPEAVQLYPKEWEPIADDATKGGSKSRSQRGGCGVGFELGGVGRAAVESGSAA